MKTENKVDVSKAKIVDDKENIDNIDNVGGENLKNENAPLETNIDITRLQAEHPDDVRMRSVSKDRSVRSISPRTRHGGHRSRRSSRSPGRSSRHSRHTTSNRSSRTDKGRGDTRTRERRTKNRREPVRERCRDYEGMYENRLCI